MNIKRSNLDLSRLDSAKKLKIDADFIPCPTEKGDELYPNGIFVFNITKMIKYIQASSNNIDLVDIAVSDFPHRSPYINESYLDSVSLSQPAIIAEISPGHYNLIDGHHRMEKARRLGMKKISAYKLNVDHHIAFLIDKNAYLCYIEYWNGKLKYRDKKK